jgi:hypothetical protein
MTEGLRYGGGSGTTPGEAAQGSRRVESRTPAAASPYGDDNTLGR